MKSIRGAGVELREERVNNKKCKINIVLARPTGLAVVLVGDPCRVVLVLAALTGLRVIIVAPRGAFVPPPPKLSPPLILKAS